MQKNGALSIQDLNNNSLWISKLKGTSTVGFYCLKLKKNGRL
jgi:hypothetical protein